MKEKILIVDHDAQHPPYTSFVRRVVREVEVQQHLNGKKGIAKIFGKDRSVSYDFTSNPLKGEFRGWVCNLGGW